MAKEKEAESEPTTLSASREFAARLKAIANHRGMKMVDALDKYAGPAIVREFRKCVEEMHAEVCPTPVGGEGG